MDKYEVKFQRKLKEIEAFKADLKDVFQKHQVTLEDETLPYWAGGEEIQRVLIKNKVNNVYNFNEILIGINVIKI
jgi:hypothetical protein